MGSEIAFQSVLSALFPLHMDCLPAALCSNVIGQYYINSYRTISTKQKAPDTKIMPIAYRLCFHMQMPVWRAVCT